MPFFLLIPGGKGGKASKPKVTLTDGELNEVFDYDKMVHQMELVVENLRKDFIEQLTIRTNAGWCRIFSLWLESTVLVIMSIALCNHLTQIRLKPILHYASKYTSKNKFNFLAFFSRFHSRFGYQHIGIQNASENLRKNLKTREKTREKKEKWKKMGVKQRIV